MTRRELARFRLRPKSPHPEACGGAAQGRALRSESSSPNPSAQRPKLNLAALATWTLVTAWMSPAAAAVGTPPERTAEDPRTVELLDHDCRSDLGRRQLTLFANGTVRLRQGPRGEEALYLLELSPSDLDAYLRRLAAEDLSESDADSSSVGGDWVERCALELALPGRRTRRFTLDAYTPPSLALSRVMAVVRELAARVEEDAPSGRRLPAGYEPRPGDLLERLDGVLYRVIGTTADGKGLELQGADQPFTLFVRVEDLRREFVALVDRR